MSNSDEDMTRTHKTWRISIISTLIFLIGFLFFSYKTDACKPDSSCKEEFIEFIPQQGGCATGHKCSAGATIEIVTLPNGKSGTMCHCNKNIKLDAGQ